MAQHALFVFASFVLFLAFLACGTGFFAPFWLGHVTNPVPGSGDGSNKEDPTKPYITVLANSSQSFMDYGWRGLWAQCASVCQWIWAQDWQLQNEKFTELREYNF